MFFITFNKDRNGNNNLTKNIEINSYTDLVQNHRILILHIYSFIRGQLLKNNLKKPVYLRILILIVQFFFVKV
jgi:hypothetical protein